MAGIFDVNVPGVQSGADLSGHPVVNNSTASAITSVGNLAGNFLDSFGPARKEHLALVQKQQIGAAEADLSQRLTAIQDAREQGQLTQAQSRMRARAAYNQAVANNPIIRDKLSETYTSIINTKGLGDNIAEQTEQEKMRTSLWKEAMDNGFASIDDDADKQEENINNYQRWKAQQQQLAWAKAQLEYQTAKVGLTNANLETISKKQSIATGAINQQRAKLGLAADQAEFTARSAVGQMAASYGIKTQNSIDSVMQELQQGKIDKQGAIVKLQGLQSDANTLATSELGGFGSQYVGAITSPLNDRVKNAIDLVNGNIDKTVFDNNIQNILHREQFNAMNTNRDIAMYAALSDLFKNSAQISMRFANSGAAAYLNANSKPNAPALSVTSGDPDHKAAIKTGLDVIRSGISKINSNTIPKGSNIPDEVPVQLNNFFKGIRAAELQNNNPSDYNDVVIFLASADFGNYMKTHSSALNNPQAMEGAASVMKREYSNHAVDVVIKEFLDKNISLDGSNKLSDGITTVGRTGRVTDSQLRDMENKNVARPQAITATYTAGGVIFSALDANNKAAVRSAQDLNKKAAPVLNNVVRLTAHLEGSTDYKAVWKDRFATRFDLDKNAIGESTPKLSDVAGE